MPPLFSGSFNLDQTIAFSGTSNTTGSQGGYVPLAAVTAEVAHPGGNLAVQLDGFQFEYPTGFSAMGIDLRITVQGSSRVVGSQRYTPEVRFDANARRLLATGGLSAGTCTITCEVRSVLFGGPPIPIRMTGLAVLTASTDARGLRLTPDGPLTVAAGAAIRVGLYRYPLEGDDLPVTLTSRYGRVSLPAQAIVIPSNSTTFTEFEIGGALGGRDIVTATADGYEPAVLEVAVLPALFSVTPTSGMAGSRVVLSGAGFDRDASAVWGRSTSRRTTAFIDTRTLEATVPEFNPGTVGILVEVGDQSTQELPFLISEPIRPGELQIIRIISNPPGSDLDGEVIQIANMGDRELNLKGVRIASGPNAVTDIYRFEDSVVLPRYDPNTGSPLLSIWTGQGESRPFDYFLGRPRPGQPDPVWNNKGDTGYIFVGSREINRATYGRGQYYDRAAKDYPAQPYSILRPDHTFDAGSDAVVNCTVQLTPPAARALAVELRSSVLDAPLTGRAGGDGRSEYPMPPFHVRTSNPGNFTVQASTPGYRSNSATILVRPVLTAVTPAAAQPGAVATVSGRGFVAPMSILVGSGIGGGGASSAVTVEDSNRGTFTVPFLLGTWVLHVISGGVASNTIPFTVLQPAFGSIKFVNSTLDSDTLTIWVVDVTVGNSAGEVVSPGQSSEAATLLSGHFYEWFATSHNLVRDYNQRFGAAVDPNALATAQTVNFQRARSVAPFPGQDGAPAWTQQIF